MRKIVLFLMMAMMAATAQAQGVTELEYWKTIANRLYYAAYNAVSALLILLIKQVSELALKTL